MQNLSVVVPEDSKRFVHDLLIETKNTFNSDVIENTITFFDIKDEILEKLCLILAKTIVKLYEKEMLLKAVNKKCLSLSKSDKIEIWKMAMSHLHNDFNDANNEYFSRINLVKKSLYDCFCESDWLSLQGFINFRMREYIEEIETLTEFSAKEYEIDCEYREFVMMLKCYISLQSPKYFDVHIFYGKDVLIFGDGINITNEYLKEYRAEIGTVAENKDDFVLNSLILIAPKKIKITVIDVFPEKEFVDTLKSVFENKISIN